jgi:hypothetical protein
MIANATTYDEIARAVANKLAWDYDNLTTTEWALLRTEISAAYDWAARAYWFEDLMTVQRCQLKADWSAATTYAAGTWVFHEGSEDYYLSLQVSTNQEPATFDGEEWDTNTTYWARLWEEEDFDAGSWSSGYAYTLGLRVTWNNDIYACILAHTSSSSIIPTNTTYWVKLSEFDYTIPYTWTGRPVIGRVREIRALDPRAYPGANRFEFTPTAEGIRVEGLDVARPWVWYRVRSPEFTGADYVATTTYTAEAAAKAIWGL